MKKILITVIIIAIILLSLDLTIAFKAQENEIEEFGVAVTEPFNTLMKLLWNNVKKKTEEFFYNSSN